MVYVENKRKELKTKYIDDTPELGKQMHLIPQEKSLIPKRLNVGIG